MPSEYSIIAELSLITLLNLFY